MVPGRYAERSAVLGSALIFGAVAIALITRAEGATVVAVMALLLSGSAIVIAMRSLRPRPMRSLADERYDLREHVAVLAHELSGPITSVGVAAQMLARDLRGRDAERRALAIAEEARHMAALLEALSELSAYESGGMTLSLRAVDVGELIHGGVGLVPPSHHALHLDIPHGALVVSADDRRIRQVLRNLVENAAKYSAVGTRIEVRAATTADGRSAIVQVRDHGRGVPPAERGRLFEKFGRLSTSAGTRGSGLGLYLCRAIVEEHGGRIWGEWPASGGSIFSFTLPLAKRPASARDPVEAAAG